MSSESNTLAERVAQLSDGQRDCLRLVYGHMTSKDIARALKVSPHTVDMRLRTAMRTLDVGSRIDAARTLVSFEGTAETTYQSLIYQPSDIAREAQDDETGSTASNGRDSPMTLGDPFQTRLDTGPAFDGPPRYQAAPVSEYSTEGTGAGLFDPEPGIRPTAFRLPWGRRNDLGVGARLGWIAVIAIGSMLGFGAVLTALEALKHLL